MKENSESVSDDPDHSNNLASYVENPTQFVSERKKPSVSQKQFDGVFYHERNEIYECSYYNWYKIFRKFSIPSKCIKMPPEILIYLKSDRVILPKECRYIYEKKEGIQNSKTFANYFDYKVEKNTKTKNTSGKKPNHDDLIAPDFSKFSREIESVIEELGGSAFIKTNWHAPQDAVWVTLTRSLKVVDIIDVYQLLKVSTIVQSDVMLDFLDTSSHKTNVDTKKFENVGTKKSKKVDPKKYNEVDTKKFKEVDAKKPKEVDAKKPKEVDTKKPEEVDTKKSKKSKKSRKVDTKKSEEVNTVKSEEVDTKKSKEVDAKKPKEVDAKKPKEVDTKKPEEVDTKKSKKSKNVDTKKSKNVDTKKSEEVETKKSEGVDTKKSEEVDTKKSKKSKKSKKVDTKKSEEVNTVKSEEVDTKKSKEVDAKKLKEVDAKKPKEVDTKKPVEVDTKKSKKSKNVDTKKSEEVETKKPEGVETKKSEEEETKKSEEGETTKSEEKVETKKSEEKVETTKSEEEVDTKKSEEEVDTKKSEEVDIKKSEEVDTKKSEEVETKKSEEVYTKKSKKSKKSKKVDTKISEEVNIKKSEEVDTKKSKEVDAKKPKEVDTKKPEEVDTKKSKKSKKSKKVDTKKSEEADANKSKEINTTEVAKNSHQIDFYTDRDGAVGGKILSAKDSDKNNETKEKYAGAAASVAPLQQAIAIEHYLIIKKWINIEPGTEFRCFVKNRSLIAIAPRKWDSCHPDFGRNLDNIINEIISIFKEQIKYTFKLNNFVFDIVRISKDIIYIIDFQPFDSKYTNSLSFTWNELSNWDIKTEDDPEIRLSSELNEHGVQPNRNTFNNFVMPVEIANYFGKLKCPPDTVEFLREMERDDVEFWNPRE